MIGRSAYQKLSPSLVDWYMRQGGRAFNQQRTDRLDDGRDNLFAPMDGTGSAPGEFGCKSRSSSPYTRHLELHPNCKRLLNAAALASVLALVRWVGW